MKEKKETKIMIEIYRKLFKASSPSGAFDAMMAKGVKNERDQIVIPFDDYFLSESEQDKIIENVLQKYKVKEYIKPSFRATIVLGCSPRYTKK